MDKDATTTPTQDEPKAQQQGADAFGSFNTFLASAGSFWGAPAGASSASSDGGEETSQPKSGSTSSPLSALPKVDFGLLATSVVSKVQEVTAKTGEILEQERQRADQFLKEKQVFEKTKQFGANTQKWVESQIDKLESFDDTPGAGGQIFNIADEVNDSEAASDVTGYSRQKDHTSSTLRKPQQDEDEIGLLLGKGLTNVDDNNGSTAGSAAGGSTKGDHTFDLDNEGGSMEAKTFNRDIIDRTKRAAAPVDVVAVGDTLVEVPRSASPETQARNKINGQEELSSIDTKDITEKFNEFSSKIENNIDKLADNFETALDKQFGGVSKQAEEVLERGWENMQSWIGVDDPNAESDGVIVGRSALNKDPAKKSRLYLDIQPTSVDEVCARIETYTLDPRSNPIESARFAKFLESDWSENSPDKKNESIQLASISLQSNPRALEYFKMLVVDAKNKKEAILKRKKENEKRIKEQEEERLRLEAEALEKQKQKEVEEAEAKKKQQEETGFSFGWLINSAIDTFNEETGMHVTKESIAASIKTTITNTIHNGTDLIQGINEELKHEPIEKEEFLCRFRFRYIQTERRSMLAKASGNPSNVAPSASANNLAAASSSPSSADSSARLREKLAKVSNKFNAPATEPTKAAAPAPAVTKQAATVSKPAVESSPTREPSSNSGTTEETTSSAVLVNSQSGLTNTAPASVNNDTDFGVNSIPTSSPTSSKQMSIHEPSPTRSVTQAQSPGPKSIPPTTSNQRSRSQSPVSSAQQQQALSSSSEYASSVATSKLASPVSTRTAPAQQALQPTSRSTSPQIPVTPTNKGQTPTASAGLSRASSPGVLRPLAPLPAMMGSKSTSPVNQGLSKPQSQMSSQFASVNCGLSNVSSNSQTTNAVSATSVSSSTSQNIVNALAAVTSASTSPNASVIAEDDDNGWGDWE